MIKEALVPPGYPTRFMKKHPHVIIDRERAHLMATAEDPYQTMARFAKEARLSRKIVQTLKNFAYGAAQQAEANADSVPTVVYVHNDPTLSHLTAAASQIANLLTYPERFEDIPEIQISESGLQQRSQVKKIRNRERTYRTKIKTLPPEHPSVEKKIAEIYAIAGGGEKKEVTTETDSLDYFPESTQTFITDTPLGIRIREIRHENIVRLYAERTPQDYFI
jgi:hypothetical protein